MDGLYGYNLCSLDKGLVICKDFRFLGKPGVEAFTYFFA